jgi:hypothetical protein
VAIKMEKIKYCWDYKIILNKIYFIELFEENLERLSPTNP